MTTPDPTVVARLFRQRQEMGLPPLVLASSTRDELLASLESASLAAVRSGLSSGEGVTGASSGAAAPSTGAASTPAATSASPAPPAPRRPAGGLVTAPRTGGSAEDGGGTGPTPALPDLSELGYDEVRDLALGCTRCGLSETRNQVVFSDGNPDARLVVVGEAPGANEDRTGLPFVGAAGKLLDLMLASVDLSRKDSVYICNVLKCRPPGNRNPLPAEIKACSPFLLRQLELVKPRALLAVGTFAAQLLTSVDAPLGTIRGTVHRYQGIPLVVTYHPAALLRNSGWVQPAWDDLQLLRQVMD